MTSPSPTKPRKHECADCGKPNAVGRARLCPTCKRKHRKASAKRAHDKAVAEKYGMKPEDYDRLYEAQGGRCAICRTATGKARRLAVDHNHETGEVRGLLCSPCNHDLLGRAHDSTVLLYRAIEYLENPPARRTLNAVATAEPEDDHRGRGRAA